jgi:SRSO17 transposase
MKGLMQARRKNPERMAEMVPGSNDQALRHLLCDSPWNERKLLDQIAREADDLLGGREDSCFLIDESSFKKKGSKSVGVARQWLGRTGKVDNGQVAVFGALASGDRVTPVDVELYLPKEWTRDAERCRAAGVPEERRTFRTKHDLALEIVRRSRENGLRYKWIGADGFYGEKPAFLNALDDLGEVFLVDVHRDQRIYIEDPRPYVPEPTGRRGRKPIPPRTDCDSFRVDKVPEVLGEEDWEQVALRESTKGTITVPMAAVAVWTWDGKESAARPRVLLVRRSPESDEVKYSLTNASPDTPTEVLARMQARRYWIERTFEDAKSQSGMADYQIRKWRGWHHHMALVMLAMLFMLKVRLAEKDKTPLLSCADIERLLARFLPRRDVTAEEVLRQMEERHRRRQASIDSARRRQQAQQHFERGVDNVTK